MNIDELIQELHTLNSELEKYEKKYNLLSPYFFKLYEMGKLEENDDYLKWAGLYRIKQNRETQYKQCLPEALSAINKNSDIEVDLLVD